MSKSVIVKFRNELIRENKGNITFWKFGPISGPFWENLVPMRLFLFYSAPYELFGRTFGQSATLIHIRINNTANDKDLFLNYGNLNEVIILQLSSLHKARCNYLLSSNTRFLLQRYCGEDCFRSTWRKCRHWVRSWQPRRQHGKSMLHTFKKKIAASWIEK